MNELIKSKREEVKGENTPTIKTYIDPIFGNSELTKEVFEQIIKDLT